MRYSTKQFSTKLKLFTLIPILAATLIAINATDAMANNLSNERNNPSEWRNVQSSPADGSTRSTRQNPSREIILTPEEAKIFKLISQERAKAGLPQLEIDSVLTELARAKSLDMVSHNYFGHFSERFGTIHDQLKVKDISYCNAAENLAGGSDLSKTHRRLLASPAHRSNILNPKFKKVGIGIITGSSYGKMITQIFID